MVAVAPSSQQQALAAVCGHDPRVVAVEGVEERGGLQGAGGQLRGACARVTDGV
jgi:hypothetical protein